jgi:hypothetical protein
MKIHFVISDTDYQATAGKAANLVLRLRDQLNTSLSIFTNEQWVTDELRSKGLESTTYPFVSPGISIAQRMASIEKMIETTKDIYFPNSELPIWKIFALDDFAGSLLLSNTIPIEFPVCDLMIMPIQGVDNNSQGGGGLYVWMASEARKRGIPIIGIEVSPLGTKQRMILLPMDHYCFKNPESRFLLCETGVPFQKTSMLPPVERYCLRMEKTECGEAYLSQETILDQALNIPRSRFVVFMPHHVAYIREFHNLLKALYWCGDALSVIVRVDPKLTRRQYNEVDMVMKLYPDEMNALPSVRIDGSIGTPLLMMRSHLVLSTTPSAHTEWANEQKIPILIHQVAGYRGWTNPTMCWEPYPDQLKDRINDMLTLGHFPVALATVVENVLGKKDDSTQGVL